MYLNENYEIVQQINHNKTSSNLENNNNIPILKLIKEVNHNTIETKYPMHE